MNRTQLKKEAVWKQILRSSASMEEAAQKNDWTGLNQLIESRQRLLNTFFSEPVAQGRALELEKIRDDIKLIMQQDSQTQELSRRNKSILATGLKKLRNGKNLAQYYR